MDFSFHQKLVDVLCLGLVLSSKQYHRLTPYLRIGSQSLSIMWSHKSTVRLAVVACVATATSASATLPSPTDLRVEYLTSPINIGLSDPRFSFIVDCGVDWSLSGCERGMSVYGYRIVVTETQTATEVWDSKVVQSDGRTSQVVYGSTGAPATPLKPNTDYAWSAQWIADDKGTVGGTSNATFSTALLSGSDWEGAEWIGSSDQRHLQRTLTIPDGRTVRRARAFVAAPGCHTLIVNGKPSQDTFGVCPWTVYEHRMMYQTHDIASVLTAGDNKIELLLGRGMWVHNGATDPAVKVCEYVCMIVCWRCMVG